MASHVTLIRGQELTVSSEISPFFERETESMPVLNENNMVSKFSIIIPEFGSDEDDTERDEKGEQFHVEKDKDGDYIVPRKKLLSNVIVLEHCVYTKMDDVGLQIWRAALLLSDFIIHNQKLFKNQTVLELGSGVGLTSIVAGIFAKQVISTDIDSGDILRLLRSNVDRNKDIIRGEICVRALDFFDRDWSDELQKKIDEASIILASDVIYDNHVTEAFIETLTKILDCSSSKTVYIAMEKRYVFTVAELDTVAPSFEHLIECVKKAQSKKPFSEWSFIEMPLNFGQYFNYERTKELVMFKILN